MGFIEMCIFAAAAFGVVNFATILFLQNKIDDFNAEIKELKTQKSMPQISEEQLAEMLKNKPFHIEKEKDNG